MCVCVGGGGGGGGATQVIRKQYGMKATHRVVSADQEICNEPE